MVIIASPRKSQPARKRKSREAWLQLSRRTGSRFVCPANPAALVPGSQTRTSPVVSSSSFWFASGRLRSNALPFLLSLLYMHMHARCSVCLFAPLLSVSLSILVSIVHPARRQPPLLVAASQSSMRLRVRPFDPFPAAAAIWPACLIFSPISMSTLRNISHGFPNGRISPDCAPGWTNGCDASARVERVTIALLVFFAG